MHVLDFMDFKCKLSGDGKCHDPSTGVVYRCDSFYTDGGVAMCKVSGREMLYVTQGVGVNDNYWYYFGYLCAIAVCLKLIVLFLSIHPFDRIVYSFQHLTSKDSGSSTDLKAAFESRRVCKAASGDSKGSYAQVTGTASTGSEDRPVPPPLAVSPTGKSMQIVSPREGSFKEKSFHSKATACLSWKNMSVILPKTGAKLIDNVSGFVKSGRTLALMGPSGAGENKHRLIYLLIQSPHCGRVDVVLCAYLQERRLFSTLSLTGQSTPP
jgi:hypothetical protein